MRRPFVAIDMDGVLAKFTELLIRVFNARYATAYGRIGPIEDWKVYKIEDAFPPAVAELLYGIFREPGYFASLDSHEDAHGAVAELLEFADVEVCSMPPFREILGRKVVDAHSAADKIGWLVRLFPELAADVTLTNKKDRVRADSLIDDSGENIIKWCAEHPNGVGYLVERPWNESTPLPTNAIRGSLKDAPALLKKRLCQAA